MIGFVFNPHAGKGAAARALPGIKAAAGAVGFDFQVLPTSAPGEAADLTRRLVAAGAGTIVAAGGDGTIHEVANALLASGATARGVRLGIVPLGSGNDFARSLGVPTDILAACKLLAGDGVRWLDVGCVTDLGGPWVVPLPDGRRWFVNGLGVGFTAAVVIEAMALRRLTGLPLYVSALLRAVFLRHHTPRACISRDGEELATSLTLLEACNGQWEGGGFWIAPSAQLDDGRLQFVTARGMGRLRLLGLVPAILKGAHAQAAEVDIRPGRQLTVVLDEPAPVQADGELLARAATHFALEVQPGALPVTA